MKRAWTSRLIIAVGLLAMANPLKAAPQETAGTENGPKTETTASSAEQETSETAPVNAEATSPTAAPVNDGAPPPSETAQSDATTTDETGPQASQAGAPLTLDQALEKALANHPTFRNIDEMLYQADMSIYQAWTMLMPYISADAHVTLNQSEVSIDIPLGPAMDASGAPTDGIETMSLTIQDLWAKGFGFAANLTLFNPQSIPIIKMAYDAYEKAKLTAQIQRNDLLFAVTSAYYQAYSMKEMIRVAEENVAMAQEFLRHASILKQAGQSTRIDVNRAEIQLVQAEKELKTATDAETQALLTLKQLINTTEPFSLVGPDRVTKVNDSIASLKSTAVNNRTEFKEAAVTKRIADRNRELTLYKFLPKFDLTYSWSWASAEGFTGSNINWTLIFGAKWDLFLGGSRAVEYKVRQSEIRMASTNIDKLTLDIQSDVEQKHLDMTKRQQNIEILNRQVTLADENYQLVSKQFQAGLVSSLDVVNASTELRSKRVLLVYERLLFDLSVLTLRKAIGEYSALSFVPAG